MRLYRHRFPSRRRDDVDAYGTAADVTRLRRRPTRRDATDATRTDEPTTCEGNEKVIEKCVHFFTNEPTDYDSGLSTLGSDVENDDGWTGIGDGETRKDVRKREGVNLSRTFDAGERTGLDG